MGRPLQFIKRIQSKVVARIPHARCPPLYLAYQLTAESQSETLAHSDWPPTTHIYSYTLIWRLFIWKLVVWEILKLWIDKDDSVKVFLLKIYKLEMWDKLAFLGLHFLLHYGVCSFLVFRYWGVNGSEYWNEHNILSGYSKFFVVNWNQNSKKTLLI